MIEADAETAAVESGSDDTISGYSYDEIEAAVLQTESGRAFLAEHARRVRIESELQLSGEFADLRARLAALYRKLDEMGAAQSAPAARSQPTSSVSVPAVFVRPPAPPASGANVPAPYVPPARFNVEPLSGTARGIPATPEPDAVDWVPDDAPELASRPAASPPAAAPDRPRAAAASQPAGTSGGARMDAERPRAESAADWFMLQEDPILDTSGLAPAPETASAEAPGDGSEAGSTEPADAALDQRADAQHSALTGMLRRMRRAMGEAPDTGQAGDDRSRVSG